MFLEVFESLGVLLQESCLPLVYLFLEALDLRPSFVPQKPDGSNKRTDDTCDDFDKEGIHIYLRTRPYTMIASTRDAKDIANAMALTKNGAQLERIRRANWAVW